MRNTAKPRVYRTFAQNTAPAWRNQLRADEMPSREKMMRPTTAAPRRAKDWR